MFLFSRIILMYSFCAKHPQRGRRINAVKEIFVVFEFLQAFLYRKTLKNIYDCQSEQDSAHKIIFQ